MGIASTYARTLHGNRIKVEMRGGHQWVGCLIDSDDTHLLTKSLDGKQTVTAIAEIAQFHGLTEDVEEIQYD